MMTALAHRFSMKHNRLSSRLSCKKGEKNDAKTLWSSENFSKTSNIFSFLKIRQIYPWLYKPLHFNVEHPLLDLHDSWRLAYIIEIRYWMRFFIHIVFNRIRQYLYNFLALREHVFELIWLVLWYFHHWKHMKEKKFMLKRFCQSFEK